MRRSLTRHAQSHGTDILTASTQIISHKQRWHKNKSNDCSYTGQAEMMTRCTTWEAESKVYHRSAA